MTQSASTPHTAISQNQTVELTHLSAVELAQAIRLGELSAIEVVEAHIRRCQEVHSRLNALVVPRFDEARREAARLRQMREFGDARAVMLDEGSVGFPKTVAASR